MENNRTETPKISVTEFTNDANDGMSKHDLANKYGISKDSVKQIANTLGLKLKRAVTPRYTLINDNSESIKSQLTSILNN